VDAMGPEVSFAEDAIDFILRGKIGGQSSRVNGRAKLLTE
jgi:hypothetical protein